MTRKYAIVAIFFLLSACQKPPAPPESASQDERPIRVSVCELSKNPETYDHQLVAVEGELSQGNEEFSLYAKDGSPCGAIWLDIGGKSVSGTVYCCGGNQGYSRPLNLTIDGIEIPLSDDDRTKNAIQQIQRRSQANYSSSDIDLIGRFFAGGHYGHFGASKTLLVIQRVLSLKP
jgi:hypothetical protein